jgi:hypothetical protein
MVAAAFWSGGGSLAGSFSIMGASVSYGQLALFGGMMILSGITQLMSRQPKKPSGLNDQSFGIHGIANTTTQGGVIPVAYGDAVLVGSTVASIGYEASDLAFGAGSLTAGGTVVAGSSAQRPTTWGQPPEPPPKFQKVLPATLAAVVEAVPAARGLVRAKPRKSTRTRCARTASSGSSISSARGRSAASRMGPRASTSTARR